MDKGTREREKKNAENVRYKYKYKYALYEWAHSLREYILSYHQTIKRGFLG